MPKKVTIVGAGVVGSFIAFRLAKEGVSVTLVERVRPGAGASDWAAGNIAPGPRPSAEFLGHLSVESYNLAQDFLPEVKALSRTHPLDHQIPRIFAALSDEEATRLRSSLDFRVKAGLNARWLDGDETRKMEPRIAPQVVGGLLQENCTQVDAHRWTVALGEAAQALGAEIRIAEVVGLNRDGTRITGVRLADGNDIKSDAVVLSMGAWTGEVSQQWIGISLATTAYNTQKLHLRGEGEPLKYTIDWGGVNVVPRRDGMIHAGSRHDLATDFVGGPTEEGKKWILDRVANMLPGLDFEVIEALAATPAQLNTPIIGPVSSLEGVYLAAPRDGGFGLSPVIANIMADLLIRGKKHPFLEYMLPEQAGNYQHRQPAWKTQTPGSMA